MRTQVRAKLFQFLLLCSCARHWINWHWSALVGLHLRQKCTPSAGSSTFRQLLVRLMDLTWLFTADQDLLCLVVAAVTFRHLNSCFNLLIFLVAYLQAW